MTHRLLGLVLCCIACSTGPQQSAITDVAEQLGYDGTVEQAPGVADVSEEDLEPPQQVVRVGTFNVRNGVANDGPDSWKNRADLLVEVFADLGADVVGVQEAWIFQLEYIREGMPLYDWVGISRAGGDLDEFCAIFYRTDRFQEVDSGTFWLSDTPDVPSKFEGQALPRICTWVHLQPLDGSAPFYLFNTHFTHLNLPEVRAESAQLILDRMAELGGTAGAFLTGDFNAAPGSLAYEVLAGHNAQPGPLLDPWAQLDLPEEGTFHGFTGKALSTRIDWVLHGPDWTAQEATVIQQNKEGAYPSDHFPVVATVYR